MKKLQAGARMTYLVASLFLVLALLFASSCASSGGAIDDWQIKHNDTESGSGRSTPSAPAPTPTPTPAPTPSPASSPNQATIGLATGGAKDINNFRENIKNDYLPLPTDITYEGLFYDYYFDTGQADECNKLFCPSYTYAVTKDPFSGEVEYYLSVGLNSGMKESDFQRKKLNLIIVLDISDSMNGGFNEYYYDRFGKKVQLSREERTTPKIEVAKEAVAALLDHLTADDRFGMVLFNKQAYLAKPLALVGDTDMEAIKDHILEIRASKGTNLASGMQLGTELLNEYADADQSEYENRIIFLTDAMPNTGEIGEEGLLGITDKNANSHIYTTFIGIGVDFNTELVEYITKIRGANYYSVHSPGQFRKRMDDEFEYMVTPLVFNLRLRLEAEGWEIEKVYGSPEADEATGELMKVNTLFPSEKEEGQTRGGLILLKLKKLAEDSSLRLGVTYEDRNGNEDSSETAVLLADKEPEFFENNGIRKGIILARYADLAKNWIIDEQEHVHLSQPWEPSIDREHGIIVPQPMLSKWERQSLPLTVSLGYQGLFKEFSTYFAKEMEAIGDDTLEQELDILDILGGYVAN